VYIIYRCGTNETNTAQYYRKMWDTNPSQRWCWRYNTCVMWYRADGQEIPDIKEKVALIFSSLFVSEDPAFV